MKDKTSRALRRHHRARLLRRAIKITARNWYRPNDIDWEMTYHRAVRRFNHMQCCSCPACGNPRNHKIGCRTDQLTMQENKEEERVKYEMEELDTPDDFE